MPKSAIFGAKNFGFFEIYGVSAPGMWKRKLEAEAVEAVKFCGSGSTLKKRSWKRKRTRKHLTFWGAGSESIFHKTWGRDVKAEAGSGGSGTIFVEAEALWRKKLETKANSEATNFIRSWKGKKHSTASTSLVRTDMGGWASADIFRTRGKWGQFFAILCGCLLWTVPIPNAFSTTLLALDNL